MKSEKLWNRLRRWCLYSGFPIGVGNDTGGSEVGVLFREVDIFGVCGYTDYIVDACIGEDEVCLACGLGGLRAHPTSTKSPPYFRIIKGS